MRLDTISPNAWAALEKKHPAAYHLLLVSSLHGELETLKSQQPFIKARGDFLRLEWVDARIAELQEHFDRYPYQEPTI